MWMKKFSESETHFKEFGLDVKWARDLEIRKPEKKGMEIDGDEGVLLSSLLLVVITGWGTSIAVFLLELVWYHLGEKLIREILKERGSNNRRKVIKIQVQSRI